MQPMEWRYESETGLGDIYAQVWSPETVPRAVIQIAHGMAEHIARYADFAEFLVKHGYAVVMNDHAGHGRSIQKDEHRGYFGEKDGWTNVVQDLKVLRDRAAHEFPDVPMVLMGHSMGSFLARAYAALYPQDHAMYIFSGTAGKNSLLRLGRLTAKMECKRNGAMKPSKLLQKMSFGSYNKAFKPVRTGNDWLTGNHDIVDAYEKDPLCGFAFTAEAMLDLFGVIEAVTGTQWAAQVPDVPIYLFFGTQDPVGANGKGVRQVADWLKKTGHRHVILKPYEGGRHEMLNEENNKEVYDDVLRFLESNISAKKNSV